ncbi:9595_t:CDS:2 [Dentiscutata erythropus]|uniref:9595_t:CDS:1 n=1 Tax=Dentiscutata erythropus TaxID=1348616 RepID=A0A9N9EKE4_9GLOM|nr:9595_t:CDS:2 [Dentiscutata erythropus]
METKSTLRQYRNREKKSPEKHRECLSNNQNRRLKSKAEETAEEHEEWLARDRE